MQRNLSPPEVPPAVNLPLQSQLSLAKDKIRILLLEGVNDSAVEMMKAAGYWNIERRTKALEGDGAARGDQGRAYSRHPLAHPLTPAVLEPPTG